MVKINSFKDIDVVILCGGFGSRLKALTKGIPKPMIKINQRPFLDILIEHITVFGFRRFVLCTGYKAQDIEKYYRKNQSMLDMFFSRELKPLGTGGAIKNSRKLIKSNNFLVMNGDSLCDIDLHRFFRFHEKRNASLSIAVTKSREVEEAGVVGLNNNQEITSFNEKSNVNNNIYVNAGIYIFNKKLFSYMPKKKAFSLEYNFFPKMVNKGSYGYVINKKIFDIGTPQRFEKARNFIKRNMMN